MYTHPWRHSLYKRKNQTEHWNDDTVSNTRQYMDPWEDTWENYGYTYGGPNGVDYWREETAYYEGRYRRSQRREERKGYYIDFRQERKEEDNYKDKGLWKKLYHCSNVLLYLCLYNLHLGL